MLIALEVWSNNYRQVEATCVLAEQLGFDAFYYGESPNDLNLECWTILAALARSTDRIRLGPVIANVLPEYRSIHLLARQAQAVAAVSDGRLDFRTGVGASVRYGRPWWEPVGVTYPDYEQRLADTKAALEALSGFGPDSFSVPITVAATGQRAMALAAATADVWETSFATPAEFAQRNAEMGRLRGDRPLVRSLEIDGFVAADQGSLDQLLAEVHSDRGQHEDVAAIMDRALVGTPNQVADQLGRLAAAGVDQVLVAAHDPHDSGLLEALSEARDRL